MRVMFNLKNIKGRIDLGNTLERLNKESEIQKNNLNITEFVKLQTIILRIKSNIDEYEKFLKLVKSCTQKDLILKEDKYDSSIYTRETDTVDIGGIKAHSIEYTLYPNQTEANQMYVITPAMFGNYANIKALLREDNMINNKIAKDVELIKYIHGYTNPK